MAGQFLDPLQAFRVYFAGRTQFSQAPLLSGFTLASGRILPAQFWELLPGHAQISSDCHV